MGGRNRSEHVPGVLPGTVTNPYASGAEMPLRRLPVVLSMALAASLALSAHRLPSAAQGAASSVEPLSATGSLAPPEASVRRLAPALRHQLETDPYVFFRFVNRSWVRAVCDEFADVAARLPTVRLHGDPHLEQYAFTAASRGLDDFDDSAAGPFVIDVVRFLASVQLALRAHDWDEARTRAFDAFFEGYRNTLDDAEWLPPDPAIIGRLRSAQPPTPAAFLAWAESLMRPLDPVYEAALPAGRDALERYARRARPAIPAGYFVLKRAGMLQMGVGSALGVKVLLRLEGPTADPDDDLIVEAKRAEDLAGVPCLTVTPSSAFRVVTGAEQIGRLRHEVLVVLPRVDPAEQSRPAQWWVRSWDRTYHEVDLQDYAAAEEIVEVARDVGAQLGRGHFHGARVPLRPADRAKVSGALMRFEPRLRQEVETLTARLLTEWAAFAQRAGR